MNLKTFLTNDKQLQESCFLDDRQSVIIGYGSISPLHLGYLPMITKMLELSEEHQVEPMLIIIPDGSVKESHLSMTARKIMCDYPFLKVSIEQDVMRSLIKLNAYNRKPLAVLGERVMVDKAIAACKTMNINNVNHVPGYLDAVGSICNEAVSSNDFDSFRSHMLDTDIDTVSALFEELRTYHGQQ